MEVLNMPNKDGTGPEGKGSRTGRQMGNCKGSDDSVESELRPCGRKAPRRIGFRRGQGYGRRFSE